MFKKKTFNLSFCHITVLDSGFSVKGPFINYVGNQAGEGVTKCRWSYISLCSKLVTCLRRGEARGVKNLQNPVYVVYERPLTEKML